MELILSIAGLIICGIFTYWFRELVKKFSEYVDVLRDIADVNLLVGKPQIIDGFLEIKKEIEGLSNDLKSVSNERSQKDKKSS